MITRPKEFVITSGAGAGAFVHPANAPLVVGGTLSSGRSGGSWPGAALWPAILNATR
jgi:hypothetical protein